MTCSMERRLEIQLKDEREAFDTMRKALEGLKTSVTEDCWCRSDVFPSFNHANYCARAKAALAKADAARPRRDDDQPTPVKMEYREPLTLTDPDKDLIGDHVNKPCGEGGKP